MGVHVKLIDDDDYVPGKSVLQSVVVVGSVLQCVAVRHVRTETCTEGFLTKSACCSVLQFVAV